VCRGIEGRSARTRVAIDEHVDHAVVDLEELCGSRSLSIRRLGVLGSGCGFGRGPKPHPVGDEHEQDDRPHADHRTGTPLVLAST